MPHDSIHICNLVSSFEYLAMGDLPRVTCCVGELSTDQSSVDLPVLVMGGGLCTLLTAVVFVTFWRNNC